MLPQTTHQGAVPATAGPAPDPGASTELTTFQPLPTATPLSQLLATLASDPEGWLPPPATAVDGGWLTRLHAGPVAHTVSCRIGDGVTSDGQLWLPVSWEPTSKSGQQRTMDAALPAFAGDLGLITTSGPTLVLTGTYRPPGGALGAAADRVVLERVAHATARRWLADIAARVAAASASDGSSMQA